MYCGNSLRAEAGLEPRLTYSARTAQLADSALAEAAETMKGEWVKFWQECVSNALCYEEVLKLNG